MKKQSQNIKLNFIYIQKSKVRNNKIKLLNKSILNLSQFKIFHNKNYHLLYIL